MKDMFYKIVPACLLALAAASCEDDVRLLPLPEAVPLTMSINNTSFVMGETLQVDVKVNPDADGNEVTANEDFDIYFSAKSGVEDMSGLFDPFSGIVTFPKGEKSIRVEFPVKTSGLEGTYKMEFLAFARGYNMENSSLGIKISDYYRVSMAMENNGDRIVTEGEKFVLVASIDKASDKDINITVTPRAEDAARYKDLPPRLTIPAGRTSAKSGAVTLVQDFEMTGDLDLELSFASDSPANPMLGDKMVFKMTDLESLADPNLFDMTTVYPNPGLIFRSYEDPWFSQGGRESVEMKDKAPHINPELAAAGWKFEYAFEFHSGANAAGMGPLGNASDANKGAVLKVNKDKYAKITDEGALNIFVGAEGSSYCTSAIHYCKMGGKAWPQNATRIYPGMRIEAKVRLNGNRTGFIPMIEVKNPMSMGRDGRKAICLMKNVTGTQITQLVKGDTAGDLQSVTTLIPKAGDYNIYWMEYVDENTIHLGINGSRTLTVTRNDLDSWPFPKTETGKTVGWKGLFVILRWELFGEQDVLSKDLPAGWDADLRAISYDNLPTQGPRMEIDWMRFYTNKNYVRSEEENVVRTVAYY